MNQITQFPQLIGTYESGRSDFKVHLEQDIKASFPRISEEEINEILEAVRQNTFTLLPDGFFGGRDTLNPDIFKLYTSRLLKK